ncbi:hypothetical protein OAD23_01045 [Candidatus Thioglobus sp.]|nr:hypothetical protein [Candidatus Thioglobus sp.]
MKKTLIYLALLFCIVFIFELLNGFWFKSELEKNLLNLNALYKVDLELDSNDFYENSQTISYSRNNYGLRTNCQNMEDIDIVSIGGSTTDQRYIDYKETFSYILQEKISKKLDTSLCIANAGVDGHKLLANIDSLESWLPLIPSFNPSYYLLNIGINDSALIITSSLQNNRNKNIFLSYLKFKVINNSYLYSFVKKIRNLIGINLDQYGVLTHKKNIKKDFQYSSLKKSAKLENDIILNSDIFASNYEKIIKIINSRGAIPICITQQALFVKNDKGIDNAFPYKDTYLNGLDLKFSLDLINKKITEICTKENALIVNIENNYFTESDFYDFVHHNPEGSKKLANLIFNSIEGKL